MKRREFLKQAGITAAAVAATSRLTASATTAFQRPLPAAPWAGPASNSPSSGLAGSW